MRVRRRSRQRVTPFSWKPSPPLSSSCISCHPNDPKNLPLTGIKKSRLPSQTFNQGWQGELCCAPTITVRAFTRTRRWIVKLGINEGAQEVERRGWRLSLVRWGASLAISGPLPSKVVSDSCLLGVEPVFTAAQDVTRRGSRKVAYTRAEDVYNFVPVFWNHGFKDYRYCDTYLDPQWVEPFSVCNSTSYYAHQI